MDRQPTQDGHLLGGERRLASAHGGSDAIASHWSGAVACGVYVWTGCVGVCVGVSVWRRCEWWCGVEWWWWGVGTGHYECVMKRSKLRREGWIDMCRIWRGGCSAGQVEIERRQGASVTKYIRQSKI
jgi:hypothetical protein